MLLIANMFYVAMKGKKLISERDDAFKHDAWRLFDLLKSNPRWKTRTNLELNMETTVCLKNVLRVMKRFVPDAQVWSYWSQTLRNMHRFPSSDGAKAKTHKGPTQASLRS
jgi:hypothetical protein